MPETASTLEVFMSGGDDGDADLYVSSISYYNANAETWQCFPLLNVSEESCVTDDLLPLDPGGAYAVGVLGYTAVTGVSVLVRYK